MVVVPLQKGMNNLGLWTYDKVTTLQEISVVLDENNELKNQIDNLTLSRSIREALTVLRKI